MKSAILIPAYKPDEHILPDIILQILESGVGKVIVVDDGSGPEYEQIFDHIKTLAKTTVIQHRENRGKGAALRTGFMHLLNSQNRPDTVITVDADGQHLPADVERVIKKAGECPDDLILGVRKFSGDVPLRSYLGNKITRLVFRGFVGQKISDTQTGLRAIPVPLLTKLIHLRSSRYAYELEVLMALIQEGVSIQEVSIATVYEDNNSASSFRPVSDSLLIYRTLITWWIVHRFTQMVRYSLSGILSTIVDFGTYILLVKLSSGIVVASVLARILSVIIHFLANKYFTFSFKDKPGYNEILRYLSVVCFNLVASIFLIYLFVTYLGTGEVSAKVAAQMLLFLATYALLNGFVFLGGKEKN